MSKFVQAIVIKPIQFHGDTVTATLRPLKRGLYVRVLPAFQEMAAIREELKEKFGRDPTKEEVGRDPRMPAALAKISDIVTPELKDYVVEFAGPKDAAGAAVPLDVVLDAAFFTELALSLIMRLIDTANVEEGDEGKSDRPSAA